MEWQDWISAKYIEWRGDEIGKAGSVSAFARWIGVSQQTMNSWIKEGKKPDTAKSINALVNRFGGEVYDVLGVTPAEAIESSLNEFASEMIKLIRMLTPEERELIRNQMRQLAEGRGEYKIEK